MGFSKALLPWNNRPLLCAHLNLYSSLDMNIRVVTGAHSKEILPLLNQDNVERIHNSSWRTQEQRHSILLGLQGLNLQELVLIAPVDTSVPDPGEILKLIATPTPAALSYQGTTGHPIFSRVDWLLRRLNKPLCEAKSEFTQVESTNKALWNFNTPQKWLEHTGIKATPMQYSKNCTKQH